MSMVEEAINKVKEIKVRVLSTIDAFRPKILIKKPLTEIKILGEEHLAGEGIGTFMNKIRYRIESIRRGIGAFGEETTTETISAPSVTSQVTQVLETKKKKVAIHY